ncbi:uncharacterized PE-PGRS family protein PE_PGRS20-like isoform X4 [Cydia pomonella]|uniref:uncharacterized PE-PGRS family protein PE_PGRS20-like isoform X4 n=1 Tax=Cydia pomonella TaxID=82600 RepID=UPI002ADE2895|nr:uncharacterized PE-PGRS family protein PE_PGRS20-like isoform X4 [Cydia pomonella]
MQLSCFFLFVLASCAAGAPCDGSGCDGGGGGGGGGLIGVLNKPNIGVAAPINVLGAQKAAGSVGDGQKSVVKQGGTGGTGGGGGDDCSDGDVGTDRGTTVVERDRDVGTDRGTRVVERNSDAGNDRGSRVIVKDSDRGSDRGGRGGQREIVDGRYENVRTDSGRSENVRTDSGSHENVQTDSGRYREVRTVPVEKCD